jgi:predicted MFS family arabinose efflux permease
MPAAAVALEAPADDRPRRRRDLRFLLTGSAVSMLGSRLTAIGLPLLVLTLTGSPLVAGWAGFAVAAPSALVLLPAGALIDRWNSRRAMTCCELGRGVAVALAFVIVLRGHPSVRLLIALVVAEEVLGVFSALAERGIICSLVEPDDTASALARAEARTHMVVLGGRSLGAFLYSLAQWLPFLADAISFGFSASLLLLVMQRKDSYQPARAADRQLRREITEGLRWVCGDRFARIAIPLTAFTTLIGQAFIMVFLAEAHVRGLPPDRIGLILAASGGGGAIGSAAAVRLFQVFKYRLLQIQMWTWTGTFLFLAWLGSRSFFLIAFALILTGFSGALGNIALDVYLFRTVEKRMLGRATSIDRLTTYGGLAIGPVLGGAIAEECGLVTSLFVLFVGTALLTMVIVVAGRPPRARPVIQGQRAPSSRPDQASTAPSLSS